MKAIPLSSLKAEEVPDRLKATHYFDFSKYPFRHQQLFHSNKTLHVVDVLDRIGAYTEHWIDGKSGEVTDFAEMAPPPGCITTGRFRVFCRGEVLFLPRMIVGREDGKPATLLLDSDVRIAGASLYLDKGDIYIGKNTSLEADSCVMGPVIIGEDNQLRPGCFMRGAVITGDGCVFRGEAKNSVFMDRATFPHPCYVGDSLMGFATHFGNQATASNFKLFTPLEDTPNTIVFSLEGREYDTGLKKLGLIMGDHCQVGCNSVSDPATFMSPHTLVYPLTRIKRGFYGPNQIIKNRAWERGVIEAVPLSQE